MKLHRALLLAAVFALSPLDGVAEEKQIVDLKELAGSWRGWVAEVAGDEWATMNVSADGSYKASTISVTTLGKFYLEAGKLRYRSRRTTPAAMPSAEVFGTASVSFPGLSPAGRTDCRRSRPGRGGDLADVCLQEGPPMSRMAAARGAACTWQR
jgi:hypothetical protein